MYDLVGELIVMEHGVPSGRRSRAGLRLEGPAGSLQVFRDADLTGDVRVVPSESPGIQLTGGVSRSRVADGADNEIGVFHGGVVTVGYQAHHVAPGDFQRFFPVRAHAAGEDLVRGFHDRPARGKSRRAVEPQRERGVDFHARAGELTVAHAAWTSPT